MEESFETVALEASDMGGHTVKDVVCTNCLEGYCPARTPSFYEEEFMLCGAKKASEEVLAAYQKRTGRLLHIKRPC